MGVQELPKNFLNVLANTPYGSPLLLLLPATLCWASFAAESYRGARIGFALSCSFVDDS